MIRAAEVREPIKRFWTVWALSSPSSGETATVVRVAEHCEPEHEYQRVLGRVWAYSRAEALAEVTR